jgi:hypothetical protein
VHKWIECKVSGLRAMSISGELTYDMLQDLLTELEEVERHCPAGFDRFTDLRKVEDVGLDSVEIRAISDRRFSGYRGPTVRSAILASDPSVYGMIRIYTAMMEPSQINVSVFYTLEECAEWLDVNPEDIGLED